MRAIRRGVAVLCCAVLLAACQEDGPAASSELAPNPDLLNIAARECNSSGGSWGLAPGRAAYTCYRQTRDSGKTCSDATDCQGMCLARSHSCSPVIPFYGCHEVLNKEGGVQTLCIE